MGLNFLISGFLILISFGYLIIPNSPQFYGKSIRRINTKEKIVALTFDDGPNPPYTEQILDILKQHNVKATFFMVGKHIEKCPYMVKKVYQEGHEIGNHSWSHKVLICRSSKYIRKEIEQTDKLIYQLGYKGKIYFRAPKGLKFVNLPRILNSQNRHHILFDVISWDWCCPGANKIVRCVLKKVKSGSIILLHDGNGDVNFIGTDRSQTVIATDIIIQKLKARGYGFVTISELIQNNAN
ncbi:polysaccharide deacetylase family protein [Candidatus Dependentiae bacterium]|nr:polysaccharide deacetylase family protein [Candidatus Dependentiae bacterium]